MLELRGVGEPQSVTIDGADAERRDDDTVVIPLAERAEAVVVEVLL